MHRNGHAIIAALVVTLLGCATPGAPSRSADPFSPPKHVLARRDAYVQRLLTDTFTDGGFVTSRFNIEPFEPEHRGDSLIFTGIALGTLPCDKAGKLSTALRRMIDELDGGFYRHPKLPKLVSQDGALGVYWGVSRHLARCPGEAAVWREAMRKHQALGNYELNPHAAAQLLPEFTYARDSLFHRLGLGEKPNPQRLATLAQEGRLAAYDAHLRRRACYRPHIALLAMDTAEVNGFAVPEPGRSQFCAEGKALGMPTLDFFCGDASGLVAFLAAHRPNVWEYALQRCQEWESPDGRPGLLTPSVDEGVALTVLYGL